LVTENSVADTIVAGRVAVVKLSSQKGLQATLWTITFIVWEAGSDLSGTLRWKQRRALHTMKANLNWTQL